MGYASFRRHSSWYERVWFSGLFQLVVGGFIVVLIPAWWEWGVLGIRWPRFTEAQLNTLAVTFISFAIAFVATRRIQRYPGAQTLGYLLTLPVLIWASGLLVLSFSREDYSWPVLFSSLVLNIGWIISSFYGKQKLRSPTFALVPFGRAKVLLKQVNVRVKALQKPSLEGQRVDAVVADFRADNMPAEWERFLARCTLDRVPVYHYKQLVETLSGRVQIDHLSENEFGALLPSAAYECVKRLMDITLVVISAPLWLPVMLITGVLIKLESSGPMFFVQERVGQGNRPFNVYQLRSMCKDSEKNGAQFAAANDMRITRVGKVIRKTRIDEIPQFINVLKGDMSLIGPRPEQRVFVEQFEEEIPFYAYRHVVKPGITGWAQVVHGYAADADDTRVKIEHDFYYIKHFSLWLDILIIFKTIRTMLTGFGAR